MQAVMETRTKRRMIAFFAIAVVCFSLVFWARGRRSLVLEGTLQWGFEQSAFFPDGDCSVTPFWWKWSDQHDNELNTRWQSLGKPEALRVKLIGNLSWVGVCTDISDSIVERFSQPS